MPQIMPMKELRNTNVISDRCHAKQEPIFITKNGYGDLVVMSMETYEALVGTAVVDKAIATAESEIASGAELVDARDALKSLRRKYFG